jgi:hypothetical protein
MYLHIEEAKEKKILAHRTTILNQNHHQLPQKRLLNNRMEMQVGLLKKIIGNSPELPKTVRSRFLLHSSSSLRHP